MNPTPFPQSNRALTAPGGMSEEECGTLQVWTDGDRCISRWEPTAEDLERLMNGGPVWLHIISGGTQPPVALTTESPFVAPEHLFYILNRGQVAGNDCLWWGPNSGGYVCDLARAGRYTAEEAARICRDGGQAVAYPVEVVDRLAVRHVVHPLSCLLCGKAWPHAHTKDQLREWESQGGTRG